MMSAVSASTKVTTYKFYINGEWFIKTNHYKESIKEFTKKVKQENVYTDEDIQHKLKTIKFLEKLLELTTEDIELAPVEKPIQLEALPMF